MMEGINIRKISYRNAPTQEKIHAVRRLREEHPRLNQREIAEKLDIGRNSVWHCLQKIYYVSRNPFEDERAFQNWIKGHTRRFFSEKIDWDTFSTLQGKSGPIYPDLFGKDSDGIPVIVEVKMGAPNRGSVGQILEYAYAYWQTFFPNQPINGNMETASEGKLRLFIIGTRFSPHVNGICEYLRANHINIRHLCYEYYSYKFD